MVCTKQHRHWQAAKGAILHIQTYNVQNRKLIAIDINRNLKVVQNHYGKKMYRNSTVSLLKAH